MRLTLLRIVAAIAATGLVTASTVALTGTASAASADVLISQVYGGGGNSGATFTNDFIELHNVGSAPVDLTGWSVQYASAGGTTWTLSTALSGTVAPGAYYLVQEAAGAGGTTPLPTPNATGSIMMSATSGKVALVTTTALLTCGASCSTAAGVHDFIGYGAANDFETAAAPTLSNTTSATRPVGAADTDNNAADFTAGPPNPRNSATPPPVPGLRPHDVQGAAHLSPYAGRQVLAVPGVVTAKRNNGYWIQDPQPDADPATSEGLFVFTGSAPAVSVGDAITVSGAVAEFRAGGAAGTNLTTTELSGGSTTVVGSGQPLPAPTLVGAGGRVPPGTVIEDDATGSVETSGVFDPASDGIDFWESLEGMRVELDDAAVVGPTDQFGETEVVPAGSTVRTARGGIVLQPTDPNPERIVVAGTLSPAPTANVGDTLAGATVGVVDYAFSNFELLPTATPTVAAGGLARETTRAPASNELAVATFNVENLDPGDPPQKFDRLAATIVTNLASPDLVALEEVQDDTRPADDGVVTAGVTLGKLTAAIAAAGGPAYQWREIDPVNDADGGEPGGNIRVVLMFRTDRELSFVDRPGGTATSDTQVVVTDRKPQLSFSPGRIAPTDAAWTNSRKPLAGELTWRGKTLFVIANHFNSKGGDQPLYGRFQPPQRPTETQRHAQATLVHDFVAGITRVDPSARVVVLGDLNDFDYSQTTDILTAGGLLTDLPRTLPLPLRYTYVFEGNSQVLDHILLTPALSRFDYDVVHANSEFTDQVSDHEPQVVRLRL